MKRFYSRKAKILLAIACILFATCCLISTISYHILGIYDFRNRVNTDPGKAYATLALSKYDSDFNADLLNGMNCYYGIIDGNVTEDTDLNDAGTYLYRNFDGISLPKEGEYYEHTYIINDNTDFKNVDTLDDPLAIFGADPSFYIDTGVAIDTVNYDIDGIGYDTVGGKAYVYANKRFYLLRSSEYEYTDKGKSVKESVDGIYGPAWGTDKFNIDGIEYDPISKSAPDYNLYLKSMNGDELGRLSGDYVIDLSPLHGTLKEYDPCNALETPFSDLKDSSKIQTVAEKVDNKHYTFICFPNEAKLSAKDHVNDYYAKIQKFVSVSYAVRPFLPVMSIIALIIAIVCFVLFMRATGHTRHSEEIVDGPIEKLPIDLALLVTIILEYIFFEIALNFYATALNMGMTLPVYTWALGAVVMFMLSMAVGLLFCSTVAVNYKLHRLHKNNLLAKLLLKFELKSRIKE